MNIRSLKRLFRSRQYGTPKPLAWIADPFRQEAILLDRDAGRVFATTYHDGYGKHDSDVFVAPFRALQLVLRNQGFVVSLRSFPRLTVELLTLRTEHLAHAKQYIEEVLELGHIG